jgi:hypothetical protein
MIGNLMDSACKWARSRVIVTSSESNGFVTIVRDLAAVYGGSINLETSSEEGLSARLSLPACSTS